MPKGFEVKRVALCMCFKCVLMVFLSLFFFEFRKFHGNNNSFTTWTWVNNRYVLKWKLWAKTKTGVPYLEYVLCISPIKCTHTHREVSTHPEQWAAINTIVPLQTPINHWKCVNWQSVWIKLNLSNETWHSTSWTELQTNGPLYKIFLNRVTHRYTEICIWVPDEKAILHHPWVGQQKESVKARLT